MLQQIKAFFRSEGKKLLILLAIAVVYQLLAYILIYQLDPKAAASSYKDFGGFYRYLSKASLEFTITFYLLIFQACLPLLNKRKGWQFLIVVVLLFSAKFAYFSFFEFHRINYRSGSTGSPGMTRFIEEHKFAFFAITSFVFYFFQLIVAFIVAFIIHFDIRSKRQKELEKQKTDAELSAIKYQINPHFLFNSLSFIYSKTVPLSEEVSNAVLVLSDIMRYALGKEEDTEGKVALGREITHMKNVLDINQMRFSNKLNIQYSEELHDPNARVIPLVLITMVENAFKHGDLLDPANPLVIRIETEHKRLRFFISNKKKTGPKELSTGIGLQNVQQRLQLIYGDKYTFKITENEHFYTSELIIHD